MSRRVLVTGVSGFVGGALGVHLRAKGWTVAGVSRSAPRPDSTDIALQHDLANPVPASGWPEVDAIVHCAALSSPWAAPQAYQRNNVDATRHMLDFAAARSAVRRFVFISSSSVCYREGDQVGITEDTLLPERPVNLYAATKRQAEELVAQSPVPWVILRPRAVFGPGDTVLFPRILRAAREGALPLIVRPDGKSPVGDLIYIENLVHYIHLALESPSAVAGTVNLTNNEPVEIHPFLNEILERLHLPLPSRRVSLGTAMAFARVAELASQWFFGYREPPVTRFGVGVMAYSKVFDVRKMLATFGPPPVTVEQGVDRFVEWQLRQPPAESR